jgi:hypothetical protein
MRLVGHERRSGGGFLGRSHYVSSWVGRRGMWGVARGEGLGTSSGTGRDGRWTAIRFENEAGLGPEGGKDAPDLGEAAVGGLLALCGRVHGFPPGQGRGARREKETESDQGEGGDEERRADSRHSDLLRAARLLRTPLRAKREVDRQAWPGVEK